MDITDRSDAGDLTFAARIAPFEAATPLPESAVERVAWALAADWEGLDPLDEDGWEYYFDEDEQDNFRRLAEAAIAALGPVR